MSKWLSVIKATTRERISLACCLSLLTQEIPRLANCHKSWSSTSAMATLNLLATRLIIDFNSRLLSLREEFSGKRRLTRHTPMCMSSIMAIYTFQISKSNRDVIVDYKLPLCERTMACCFQENRLSDSEIGALSGGHTTTTCRDHDLPIARSRSPSYLPSPRDLTSAVCRLRV